MRIRRLSSKILGTSAVPPSPPQPPAAAASLPPAVGQHQPALVCVLNQSPWDVLPWPPTPPRLDPKERPPFNPKVEGLMDDVNKTRSDEESKIPPIILSLRASNSEEFRKIAMKKKKSTPPSTFGVKKKIGKKKKKGEEMNIKVKEEISGIAAATCNKTDGKQWKCKQPVTHPHSLCSYHRTQLQSYAKAGGGKPKKAPKPHRKRATAAVGAAAVQGSGSNSFYYYSNFGPWRGKRRGGENGGASTADTKAAVEEVDEEMESNDDDHNVEDGRDKVAGKIDVEDGDSLDEDSDGDGKSPHRRRRKPVKARSLKSLF